MRSAILKRQSPIETRPLSIVEIENPVPTENEVLIRVSACGVCRTDLHVVEGDLPLRMTPTIPGHQIVGTIEGTDQRVGVAWLNKTCGTCRFCVANRENLCESPEFTGWTKPGGFAEFVSAPADFVYPLPERISDVEIAPFLCAGIIGYRALKLTGLRKWQGARLGIYGFGAAGHVCIQIARSRGADVYVATRDRTKHQALAEELGAVWVGDTFDKPPSKLDAAIVFAPAGEIVPAALEALDKGGVLVLGGIHMSPIPRFDHPLIYGERVIRSVANNTREDGREFLREAFEIPVRTSIKEFSLDQANDALIALKNDAIRGAAVLKIEG
jgi:propanol-preferring alcohol dehydrogenase